MFIASLPVYKKLSQNRSNALARALQPLMNNKAARVLDFGTGNMFLAAKIAEDYPNMSIHGIDVIRDQNLSDALFQRFPNLSFEAYNGLAVPFENDIFDYVIASAVMHHTPDPEYFLQELKRVLKPGGSILLIEEMYHHTLDKWFIMMEDFVLNNLKKGVPVPLTFRSYKHYKQQFIHNNLRVDFEGYVRPSFPWKHHYVFKLSKS